LSYFSLISLLVPGPPPIFGPPFLGPFGGEFGGYGGEFGGYGGFGGEFGGYGGEFDGPYGGFGGESFFDDPFDFDFG